MCLRVFLNGLVETAERVNIADQVTVFRGRQQELDTLPLNPRPLVRPILTI